MNAVKNWVFDETRGVGPTNELILIALKIAYLSFRFFLRLGLGKKKRDKLLLRWKLDFNFFLYLCLKWFQFSNSLLLKIYVPAFDYKFFCRINREDFTFMTIHKGDIIERFVPSDGDTIIDVGAHLGLYSIIGSKIVGSHGRVIAIEAHPHNCEMLNRNISLNRLANVRVLHYAAYSKKGKVKLYLPEGEKGFTIYNTLMSCRARAGERYVEVSGDTLDNIINKAGLIPSEINWIKIDVEGAEFEVLNGAHSILSEARELSILIEVHGIKNVLPIKNLLNSYGFQIEYESTHEGAWRHVIFKKYV